MRGTTRGSCSRFPARSGRSRSFAVDSGKRTAIRSRRFLAARSVRRRSSQRPDDPRALALELAQPLVVLRAVEARMHARDVVTALPAGLVLAAAHRAAPARWDAAV